MVLPSIENFLHDRSIQLNPKSAEAYNNRGNARAKLGDKQGAIADFEQAMAIDPKSAEAYNNRGIPAVHGEE